jgi:hypothetical protein
MVDVNDAINREVNSRVEDVAAVAAAQVDAANKDAEALARAAVVSETGARLSALEGNVSQWQAATEARLTKHQEEITAAIAASQASILAQLAPPPPPPVKVEPIPEVKPSDIEGQKPNSNGTDTSQKPEPKGPPQRVRKLL